MDFLDSVGSLGLDDKKTDQERIDAVMQHPFFMTSALEFNGEGEKSETVEAIQSLVYDGTPVEMAENFKHQGNSCYASRKFQNAIKFYTQGIECKAEESNELNSILYSNRAAVNLELSNFRSVLYDCAWALKFNGKNIKAYFRSIKALLALDRTEECIDCCQKGLLLDPTNVSFKQDMKKALEKQVQLRELQRLREKKEMVKKEKMLALQSALSARGYQMKSSLSLAKEGEEDEETEVFQHPDASPYSIELTEGGELTFPVMFLYPEFNQSDIISSFRETDTFYAHFLDIFENPAPWDPNHLYHPQTLDFYFESRPDKYAKENPELVSILKSVDAKLAPSQQAAQKYVCLCLKDVLQHPKHTLIDGVVKIIVLSRSSSAFALQFRKEFKKLHQQ